MNSFIAHNSLQAITRYLFVITLSVIHFHHYLFGQNGHLTQQYNSPLYVNAAEAGAHENLSITSNFRKQWLQIGSGYTTKVLQAQLGYKNWGYGLVIYDNEAGPVSFKSTNYMLGISYAVKLSPKSILRFGIQTGCYQYRFQSDYFKFSSQYSIDYGYSSLTYSGEYLNSNTKTLLNGNGGILIHFKDLNWSPKLGLSIKNLYQPTVNCFENSYTNLLREYNIYSEFTKRLSPLLEFIPYFFFSKQGKAQNFILGSRFGYSISNELKGYLGIGLRNKDAILAYVDLPINKFKIGVSYDYNISLLKKVTNNFGALELCLSYRFTPKSSIPANEFPKTDDTINETFNTPNANNKETEPLINNKEYLDSINTFVNDSITSPSTIHETTNTLHINQLLKNADILMHDTIENKMKVNKLYHIVIHFDSDKSQLKTTYKDELDKLSQELINTAYYKILIFGHTDSEGENLYNIYLGNARALKLLEYFLEKGIPYENISTYSFGKTNPVETNNTEDGKSKNRRAEILVIQTE